MKYHHLLLPILFSLGTLALPLPLLAQNSSAALGELEAAIRKESASRKPVPAGARAYYQNADAAWPQLIAQLKDAIESGQEQEFGNILNEVTSIFHSNAVLDAVNKLRAAAHTEQQEKEKARKAQVDTLLAATAQKLQTAKEPADLDSTLDDLAKIDTRWENYPSALGREQGDRLRAARQFVMRWQDYLSNRGVGKYQDATQNLRNLVDGVAELMPRSRILALINEMSGSTEVSPADRVSAIMSKVKTLDDIPSAILELDTIRTGNVIDDPQNVVTAIVSLLNSIESTYQNYEAGLPCYFALTLDKINGFPINGQAEALALPLRVQLMRIVFPRYLGVPEKPTPDETLQAYLNRVMSEASARLDARLMTRTFTLLIGLSDKQDSPSPEVFEILVAGQNQEEAGEYVPAVLSYERALKLGGDYVPAKVVGDHLAQIKSAHPADYASALQKFMAEPGSTPPPMGNSFFFQRPVWGLDSHSRRRPRPAITPIPASNHENDATTPFGCRHRRRLLHFRLVQVSRASPRFPPEGGGGYFGGHFRCTRESPECLKSIGHRSCA
jgi:hypothetical protein